MGDTTPALADLLRSGMFLQALVALESLPRSLPQPTDIQLVKADLLQKVGRGDEACRIANAYVHSKTAPPALRARANLVLANEFRDRGDVERTVDHLQRAIALCDAGQDDTTRCWAELKLMLARSELPRKGAASGFLSQVRKDVARLGDPQVTAALHLFVSQIEAKQGLLDNARHHLRVGRGLLATNHNVWLDGMCSIHASCLSYLTTDFDDAVREARHALLCGRTSGHRGVQRAAINDLGHLYLTSDQLNRARACFKLAMRMTHGGMSEAGIVDGLAQVELASGDLDSCSRLLARIDSNQLAADSCTSYYFLYALVTKLRLLLKEKADDDALAVASSLLSHIAAFEDRSFPNVVHLLHSEALLLAGRPEEAANAVFGIAESAAEKPLETLPRVGRMIGKLHAASGNHAAAGEWFEHAARALAAAADEGGRVDVLEDYANLLWPSLRRADASPPSTAAIPLCGYPTTSRITVHPQATELAPSGRGISAASALARVTTLVDVVNRPQFVGSELQEMLRQCGAISDAVVVASTDGKDAEVVRFWGDYARLQQLLAAQSGAERIPLGRWRDKNVSLHVLVGPGLDARAAVIAMKRLVRASLELEAARREQRERAALWPLDEPIEAQHGLFASQAMLDLVASACKIAASNATVLIMGETGTGKEIIARIIHDASPRAAQPFTPFNCAAVPHDMLDSQLFGHRRGSFTGAIAHSPGVIRSTAGGTLLLDEIGEVTPDLQPKLLRFLEAQEIQPLGEPHPIPVDVRVLASTNADLDRLVAAGRFREDLYYRLNVIRLRIPPLRERREEIPMLAQHFLARFADENRKGNLRIAEETMEYLLLYAWPGNVRELLNQMRRLAALAENGAVLMPEHLSPEITVARTATPEAAAAPAEVAVRLDQPLAAAVEQLERAMVPHAMRSAGGRVEQAARLLGLSRKGLYLKRQRLGLDPDAAPAARSEDET